MNINLGALCTSRELADKYQNHNIDYLYKGNQMQVPGGDEGDMIIISHPIGNPANLRFLDVTPNINSTYNLDNTIDYTRILTEYGINCRVEI